jgi:hypothetical protein
MRQRNETSNQLFVQVADPPFVVDVGDTIEYDTPIVGLTPVSDDDVKPAKKAVKAAASGEEPAE